MTRQQQAPGVGFDTSARSMGLGRNCHSQCYGNPTGMRPDGRDSFGIQSQSIDNSPLYQVTVDDLVQILPVDIGVPDGFRVNHGHRAQLAAIETARVIDPDLTWSRDAELLATPLDVIASLLGTALATALAAVFTLIGTKKHVAGKITHTSFRARL